MMTPRTALTALALATQLLACAGPELHPGFKARKAVFQREWSIATRTRLNEAGERGVEYANPLIWENTLIFGTTESGLVALYPGLGGAIRWVLPIPGGIASELTLHESLVFFGGSDGFFYCVNAETGRVQWRYEIKNPKVSRPSIVSGKLYVTTTDDVVHSFEAATGRWNWSYRRKTSGGSTVHGASQPWTDGSMVMAGMSDGYLVQLEAADGKLKSEKRLSTKPKFSDVDASPVLDGSNGGVFYIASYDGALHALRKGSLETLWKIDSGASRSVTIDGGTLYLGGSDGLVQAIEKSSGKVLWKFETDGGVPTQPLVTDQYVIFGSSHQYLYALDKKTGELLDRWNIGYNSGFSGNLAYDAAKKLVYVVSGNANLYSLKVR